MQLTLPIATISSYDIDDFIVSSCNKVAYEAINKCSSGVWGREPYKFSLLLAGPQSSGKTYLTKIWQATSSAYIIKPNEPFTYQLLNQYPAFIIEEVGDFNVEDELLHWFNLINEHKKHLLITSNTPLPLLNLHDLSSRFNSLFRVTIDKPDEELIKILLFKNFSNFSIIVSQKLLNFLAFNLPRQFDKILELTNEINQVALSNNKKITIPLVKSIICNSTAEAI